MNPSDTLGLAIAAVAGLAILVIPGFSVRWGPARAVEGDPAALQLAVVVGGALQLAAAIALIAIGWFSAAAMAAVAIGLGAIGSIPFVRWLQHTTGAAIHSGWMLIPLGVLLAPWLHSAAAAGYPDSSTFQWYYWGVGEQLSAVGGVPASVPEYGLELRWLPDYVSFNVLSEAYRGLVGSLPETVLITAWRVPVALLGILLLYSLLRKWLTRTGAIAGLAAILTTGFFVLKFNVYKPEPYGILLGLAAVSLVVDGVRDRRPWLVLAAGVAIAVAMSAHAIAATALAMWMVGVGIAEWLPATGRHLEIARWLAAGALTAVTLVIAVGTAVQGRALVAGDALRPAIVDGVDPTWVYLNYSTGVFDVPPVPSLTSQIAASALQPWRGLPLDSPVAIALAALVAVGIVVGLRRRDIRWKAGLTGSAILATAVLALMTFFALSFDTYVPRHTGLARFGQYLPLAFALAAAFAVDGALPIVRRPRSRTLDRSASLVVAVVISVGAAGFVWYQFQNDTRISPAGREALAALTRFAEPNEIVLSNAITSGSIEFLAGVEAPFEGRQPLIEDPDTLGQVNARLLSLHELLTGPADAPGAALAAELGARWFLISDRPRILGADNSYGGSVERFATNSSYQERWAGNGVAIFEAVDGVKTSPPLGPRLELLGEATIGLLLAFAGCAGAALMGGIVRLGLSRG